MAWFQKLPSGLWQAQVARKGIRRSATFPSKSAATAWAAEVEGGILSGDRTSIPNLRMADLFSRYAKEVSPSKKGAKWEKVRLDLLGRDRIAQVRLRDLSAAHLSDWQKRRLEAVSGASVRRERNLLNNALEIARKEWGWVRQNPFEKIRRPKDGQPKERVATDEEIERILDLSSEAMRRVIVVALETGMRASELSGITATQVAAKSVVLRDTKNGTKREVPLSEKAIGALAQPPRSQDAECGNIGERERRQDAPIFNITSGSISSLFARYCTQLGIEGLTFHCLRRTAATRLSERLTVLELCAMFGWKDPRVVVKHYYKADPEAIARKLNAPPPPTPDAS